MLLQSSTSSSMIRSFIRNSFGVNLGEDSEESLKFYGSSWSEPVNQSRQEFTVQVLHVKAYVLLLLFIILDFGIPVIIIDHLLTAEVAECGSNKYVGCPVFVFCQPAEPDQTGGGIGDDGN